MAKYNLDDELSLVETFIHEYCHLVGMIHTFRRTAGRSNSAPYAIGRHFASIFGIYFKTPIKETIKAKKPSKWQRFKSFLGIYFNR